MVPAVNAITPVAPVRLIGPVGHRTKEELYTLYYKSNSCEGFYARSDPAAVLIAKRKLNLVATASEERFSTAGGDRIVKNSTGECIYPKRKH